MKKLSDNKLLMAEWDYEKNASRGLFPEKLLNKSNKKAWWRCSQGHSWEMEIYHRSEGRSCPYCSNKRVLEGYNDLKTLFPAIAAEWDYERNSGLEILSCVKGSARDAWWKCSVCGHAWRAKIRARTLKGCGCPKCAKLKRVETRRASDLKKGCVSDSKLLAEWDYEKNSEGPETYPPGSNKSVWWKCGKCGYEWRAKIANRTILNRGCPCCARKVVARGKNDLETTHPELAKEWHPTKNGDLKPFQVLAGSARKVWWLCPAGHEYRASLLHRGHGTNCPICNSGRQTSFAEQAVFFYVKHSFPDAENRALGILGRRMELDIYIPSLNTAVEYDGVFWHGEHNRKRDLFKYRECRRLGIRLFRIRECASEMMGDEIADEVFLMEKPEDKAHLSKMIIEVLRKLLSEPSLSDENLAGNNSFEVNVERDEFKIRRYMQYLKKDSLADLYPELAEEWNYEKNKGLNPKMFKPGSSQRVWWKCRVCGYEWKTDIGHRTKGKTGCPVCFRQKNRAGAHSEAKTIYQYSKDGMFIREWSAISEAARVLKINGSNITMCAKHVRRFAGGFRWEYQKLELEMCLPLIM